MSHFWKLSLVALVSLIAFTPAIMHAQVRDWDYDRIDALVEELEDFENTFEGSGDFDDIEDHYDEVLVYLEDFEIPEEHPVVVEAVSTSESVTVTDSASSSYGTFTIKVDVTAIDNDILIPVGVQTESNGKPINPRGPVGVEYALLGEVMQPLKMAAVVTSTGKISNGHFVIDEGDTETLTLTVTVDPSKTGWFSVSFEGINYTEGKDRLEFIEVDQRSKDFETKRVTIPDSAPLDTYRGYLNGTLFITTKNITEASALENCKLNASKNTAKSIRCTWGTKEIYRKDVVAAPVGTIGTKRLYESTGSHVISGTAKNTPSIGLVISGQSGDKAYASGRILVDSSGRWSVKLPALGVGTYTMTLLGEKDVQAIASGTLTVEQKPEVLPATSTKTVPTTTTSPTTNYEEPLVLPAETNLKTSAANANLSASASVALEQLLKALEAYMSTR